jgi:hypothetical protein
VRTALLAIALLLSGCVKHVSTLTPAQNITLSVDQALDVIARSNRAAAKATLELNTSKVLTDAETRAILGYNGEVDTVVLKALAANQASGTTDKVTAVMAALSAITQLPPEVKSYLSGPKANALASLAALIQSSISIAQGLISRSAAPATP